MLILGWDAASSSSRFQSGSCTKTWTWVSRFPFCVQPPHRWGHFWVFLFPPWVFRFRSQFLCSTWPVSCWGHWFRTLSFRSTPWVFWFRVRTFRCCWGGASWGFVFLGGSGFSASWSACSSYARCQWFPTSASQSHSAASYSPGRWLPFWSLINFQTCSSRPPPRFSSGWWVLRAARSILGAGRCAWRWVQSSTRVRWPSYSSFLVCWLLQPNYYFLSQVCAPAAPLIPHLWAGVEQ